MSVKVVLCGPPNTGKTCLREGLKRAILAKDLDYPYPYCLPANPDGDGAWYLPTMWEHPDYAGNYRAREKKAFTPEFVQLTRKYVESCKLPLVFVDIGGVPDEKNTDICRGATHAVILGKEAADFDTWSAFCQRSDLKVIAEIVSDYDGTADGPISIDAKLVLHGAVHHLDRMESAEDRPVVRALADHVLALTGKKPTVTAKVPYLVTPVPSSSDTLEVLTGFGRPASGAEIVREAHEAMKEVVISPSQLQTVLFDGPISVLAASALAWQAASRFSVIGFYDPKLHHFVIVHSSVVGKAMEWKPEPGTVVDSGPMPKPPRKRPEKGDAKKIFFVRGMEHQGDSTRVELGPGTESADTFELVPAALDQLAAVTTSTKGLVFDGKVPVIVAAALTCAAMQHFDYVAFLDPRLKGFVVSASKMSSRPVGMQL